MQMLPGEAKELLARALAHPERLGLRRWELTALQLKANGAPDRVIAATLGRHARHVPAALVSAREKVLKAENSWHRETIPLAANRLVTEPLRGVIPDPDHPDPEDPEHFKPIHMPLGAGETIRPTLVHCEDMSGPLRRAFRAIGV
jgi:hypothetical protein